MPKNAAPCAKLLIIVAALLLIFTGRPAAAQSDRLQCRWISAAPSDTAACDRRFSTPAQAWSSNIDCTADGKTIDDTVCCCPAAAANSSARNPRLLLIGSVAAFFAIITVLIFALQKND